MSRRVGGRIENPMPLDRKHMNRVVVRMCFVLSFFHLFQEEKEDSNETIASG
jgi:hypothetical protein